MTRINLVPVSELTDQHLLAEAREIKRLPNVILSGRYNMDDVPSEYTLGKGHCKFFYNKIYFLFIRYLALYNECLSRGFKVEYYGESFLKLADTDLYNDYRPTPEAIYISRERIMEKLALKP